MAAIELVREGPIPVETVYRALNLDIVKPPEDETIVDRHIRLRRMWDELKVLLNREVHIPPLAPLDGTVIKGLTPEKKSISRSAPSKANERHIMNVVREKIISETQARLEGRTVKAVVNNIANSTVLASVRSKTVLDAIKTAIYALAREGLCRLTPDRTKFAVAMPLATDLPEVGQEDVEAIWVKLGKQLIKLNKVNSCINTIVNSYSPWRYNEDARRLATAAVVALIRSNRL